MARGDQLDRQWRIIQTLIASRRGKTVQDLSHGLDCHPRTVYRDLQALQSAGFPVFTEKQGRTHLWALLDSAKHHVPIPVSLPELLALYSGRDMMKVFQNTVFYDELESFYQKITATLPEPYTRFLEQLGGRLEFRIRPYAAYGRFDKIIQCINEAVIHRNYLDIAYYTMSRKSAGNRRIAPYKVRFFDGTFYVAAYCTSRKALRIFVVDRIRSIQKSEEHFEPPNDMETEQILKKSFGVFIGGDPAVVRIHFDAEVAGYIEEKIWHESQQMTKMSDGSLMMELEVAGIKEIKNWILSWGAHAQVMEPEALRTSVRQEAEKIFSLYTKH